MAQKKKGTESFTLNNAATQRLLNAANTPEKEYLEKQKLSEKGLASSAVENQRNLFGINTISRKKKSSVAKRLFEAFINPFTVVLFVLAIISFITDVLLPKAGSKDPSSVIIVLVMVFISGLLRFVQEARSGKAADKLSEMVKTTIRVKRDNGKEDERPIGELVVGDVVMLAAGDMVPADMRMLTATDLFVSQSSLTGESEPLEKFTDACTSPAQDPLTASCLAFMGSNIVSGSAEGVVVNVGDNTYFGNIAQQLNQKKPTTSFEKGINAVSWVLIRFMMVMVPIVFVLNGWHSGNWTASFLFALSVAVGLTPAMLPTIVSANLAKGAVALSRKKVVIKDLNSIQNFGAMDVLCTDKTGTLTQDQVALMYSLNAQGDEDEDVVKLAYLNSYYQTGLKNLMDIAVLDYAASHKEGGEELEFSKVDEIPFDFSRRRMSVLVADKQGETRLITKGAAEEMLSICSYVRKNGQAEPITAEVHQEITKTIEKYNEDGMRVVALATKENPPDPGKLTPQDESGMILEGYLSFLDPPKDSASEAIKALEEYGVAVKILTGDNGAVTRAVCHKVGLPVDRILLGADLAGMDDAALDAQVESVSVFAKLAPAQKARVIASLRRKGHTVGFMGDGINDAAAMKQADVGISVDTAVDIAKESANIILLEKNLMVLKEGIIEGRKTYANIIKYIKMTVSSNFGNMFSVLAASAFLPFLPMLPLQLLVLNLIYDISCIGIPWDNVDADFLLVPRKWEAKSLSRFMLWMGPTSSVFDITTYLAMFFVIGPMVFGGAYKTLDASHKLLFATLFQTAWFVESLWTQTLVIHMIRTPKIPFVQSRASWQMTLFTSCGILVGTILPFTPFAKSLGMTPLPAIYYTLLAGTVLCYITLTTVVKKLYIHQYKELL